MGKATFNGLHLATSPGRVMTPRPTTEQLVAAARAHIGTGAARVIDVGTGSGAVAIAIAASCPRAAVWATDTSADAVALARANVRRHRLGDRVFVRHGDLLAPVSGQFEVIAANLPYVPVSAAADYPELATEPPYAVFAPGDGLEPYRRLVEAASNRLTAAGLLLLQLDARLLVVRRCELSELQTALAASRSAVVSAAAVHDVVAGKAA